MYVTNKKFNDRVFCVKARECSFEIIIRIFHVLEMSLRRVFRREIRFPRVLTFLSPSALYGSWRDTRNGEYISVWILHTQGAIAWVYHSSRKIAPQLFSSRHSRRSKSRINIHDNSHLFSRFCSTNCDFTSETFLLFLSNGSSEGLLLIRSFSLSYKKITVSRATGESTLQNDKFLPCPHRYFLSHR